MKIINNSPFILAFCFICFGVKVLDYVIPGFVVHAFSVNPGMSFSNPLSYFRLISHVMGHANMEHLFNNLMMLLLLGPILEEKHGPRRIAIIMLVTALVAGLFDVMFFSTGLCGASGIIFSLIILASFAGKLKPGTIPVTLILVALFWLGREFINALQPDQISQTAHLLGGACGAAFGFVIAQNNNFENKLNS